MSQKISNKKIHISKLPEKIQQRIDDSINQDSWDSVWYSPYRGLRFFDQDNLDDQIKLNLFNGGFSQVTIPTNY